MINLNKVYDILLLKIIKQDEKNIKLFFSSQLNDGILKILDLPLPESNDEYNNLPVLIEGFSKLLDPILSCYDILVSSDLHRNIQQDEDEIKSDNPNA